MTKARDTANIVGGGFSGTIAGATMEPTGDTAAGDNAAIGFTSAEGLIITGQGSTSDITLKNDADAVVFTVPTGTDDILFPDNAKAMFGAGSDLQIYHDGNSKIADVGDGKLELHSNGTGVFIQKGATEHMAKFETDGAVTLYHNNAAKLATTATGIDVTGAITVGGAALGSGGMEFIASSGEMSSAASASFTGFDSSKYDNYIFYLNYVKPATDDQKLFAYASTNGGTNYDTTNGNYHINGATDSTGFNLNHEVPAGNDTNEFGLSGTFSIKKPHASAYTSAHSEVSVKYTNGIHYAASSTNNYENSEYLSTNEVNAIQFKFGSGNIASGEITMFGIVNS